LCWRKITKSAKTLGWFYSHFYFSLRQSYRTSSISLLLGGPKSKDSNSRFLLHSFNLVQWLLIGPAGNKCMQACGNNFLSHFNQKNIMKKQTLAAYVCAAITLGMGACQLLGNHQPKSVSASTAIIGKWQVTGVGDSSRQSKKLGNSWLGGFNADSTKIFANFYRDSILMVQYAKQPADTSKYYADDAAQKLFVESKNQKDSFGIVLLTDSILQVAKDSLYITLKKQR